MNERLWAGMVFMVVSLAFMVVFTLTGNWLFFCMQVVTFGAEIAIYMPLFRAVRTERGRSFDWMGQK